MVERLAPEKSLGFQSQGSLPAPDCVSPLTVAPKDPKGSSCTDSLRTPSKEETATGSQPPSEGKEPCLGESRVNQGKLNTEHGRYNNTDHSNPRSPIRLIDPMESNKKAAAASPSSNSHQALKGAQSRLQTPGQYIALKKKEAVARCMAALNKWIDERLVAIESAHEASEASGESGKSTGSTSPPDDSKPSKPSRGAKRQFGGDDEDNVSAGGDENGQERGGNKRAKKEPELGRKWACPFFKHDPKTFGKERCCAGPGWPSIHRLKEHLYRKHLLPKHACPRCGQAFTAKKEVDNHIRADVPCKKVELVPVLGIDEAAEAKLRTRKKYGPGVTEEQRWKDIYTTLFPSASHRSVPSPYHEPNDAPAVNKAVLKHLRKELPALIQKRIESRYDQVETELLSGLKDITRDALYECCMGLPKDELSRPATPDATPRSLTPSLPATNDSPDIPSGGEPLLDLSSYLDDSVIASIDWLSAFDPGNSELSFDGPADGFFIETSDSGYVSTGTGGNISC